MSRTRAPENANETSPTERANQRTTDLDQLSTGELVASILLEDAGVASVVQAASPEIERACELLCDTLRAGGRWFNLGAGTSGRIGALDAAEIPPTFGLEAEKVQAMMAGGERALLQAVEGAEDDAVQAAEDLAARGFSGADALVAISASGTTPYTIGALEHARKLGATSLAITCAPGSPLAEAAQVAIVAAVGPEVIAGSTRMKGGLAQKMILHTLSTAVMVRLGHVRGNLMTGIRAVNAKLRERALGILVQVTGCTRLEAEQALDSQQGSLEKALAEFESSRRPR